MRPIVIAVGVQDDGQPGEVVLAAKDWPRLHALLGVPNGEAIAEELGALAMNLEAHMHLPVASHHGLEEETQNADKGKQGSGECQLVLQSSSKGRRSWTASPASVLCSCR